MVANARPQVVEAVERLGAVRLHACGILDGVELKKGYLGAAQPSNDRP
jgi:hypothetical protein